MAHQQQREFLQYVKDKFPERFENVSVVDFGSLDINGNNRWLFDKYLYTGVDLSTGPNVDIVSRAKDFKPRMQYDVVISAEMLEHDKEWSESIRNMINILKPNGMLLLTMATTDRPEHGTTRSGTSWASPFTEKEWEEEYYKNLTEKDLRQAFNPEQEFQEFEFSVNNVSKDLYFWGIKK